MERILLDQGDWLTAAILIGIVVILLIIQKMNDRKN